MIASWRRTIFIFLLLPLAALACGLLPARIAPEPTLTSTALAPVPTTAGSLPRNQSDDQTPAPAEATPEPTAQTATSTPVPPTEVGPITGEPPSWPDPIDPVRPFGDTAITSAQQAAYDRLVEAAPPERDDLELARLYMGWNGLLAPAPVVIEPLPVGTVQKLNVLNHETITINPITAELLAVGEHAYFWFDTGPGSIRPTEAELASVTENFDQIYQRSVAIFGSENKPGVDGDPRLHVVNASPMALCDLSEESLDEATCNLAGYFSADDGVPSSVIPDSNAREMFVMNVEFFGNDFYLNILTHELRHMIEDNYDRGDADWEAEGSAMMAEDLLGYPGNGVTRANLFLSEPDQQLNSWPDDYTLPAYGQGYLFNRYIYDRLGSELYRQFAASPEDGLKAIESVAKANGFDVTGEDVWQDWLVALAIHGDNGAPLEYRFGVSGLDQVTMNQVERYPATYEETVHQYAADYYRLTGDGEVTLDFTGSALAPLLDTVPASGESMWLANRANYSQMHLTREVDLTQVDAATLNYSVYYDIETGYDFAYLFVSVDGGQTWQPLVGENMQWPSDDPSSSAMTDRFYSGRSNYWLEEEVDLSPYAGQTVLVRFAYITDPILTHGGFAIDNVAIPEIGFYDDAETLAEGWTAEGFERVTATIPQQWHLQLITYPDGAPQVESLALSSELTLSRSLSLADSGGEAILVVAASAPMTLEQAHYKMMIGQ